MSELNHQHCYLIISARDRRFDGAFFTAVTSTGIYCRPICPATTPKSDNVRFFPTAHAAHNAGFRPCLRCHPEAAPGSPDWDAAVDNGAAIATAAQRRIADGYLNTQSVENLAEEFGITGRHLRRLFLSHFGMTPSAVAQNQRLLLAKQLLDQSDLPITQIAFAAGFGSLRRFNSAIQSAWGDSPSLLRQQQRRRGNAAFFELQLSYRPPYDWQQVLAFLAMRAIPSVELVSDSSYTRSVQLGSTVGLIEVTQLPSKHALSVRVSSELSPHCMELVSRLRRLFDLDARPDRIAECFANDALLAPLIAAKPGIRVPGAWDGFEVVVRAIIGQQVSVAAARTLVTRVAQRFGEPLPEALVGDGSDYPTRTFPQASRLATADLSGLGLTGRRIASIQEVSQRVIDGQLQLQHSSNLADYLRALCDLPGIGDWTAQYIAMRALHHPDAFPAADLVIRQTLREGDVVTERVLREAANAWRPWRSYAVILLWDLANQRRDAAATSKSKDRNKS